MNTIRNLFTDDEIRKAVKDADSKPTLAAKYLTELGRGSVSPQLLRYWLSNMAATGELPEQLDLELGKARMSELTSRAAANYARRQQKGLAALVDDQQTVQEATYRTVQELNARVWVEPLPAEVLLGKVNGTPMTVEALLSDLQIGKLVGSSYNSRVAVDRLRAYTTALMRDIALKARVGFRIERIVLALLGDIIESDKKHPNSGRSCDIGTAEQIHLAQLHLYELVIEPLASLGIPVTVVCVTGNHDHDGHGLAMFEPGKNHLSYGLYKALELIANKAKLTNVDFIIPRGSFTVVDIYGQVVLYEHGVGVAVSEAAMRAHKGKRAEQLQLHITYFRMGDKHTVTSFNSGQYVVNGAFFGTDNEGAEYSGILGFCSVPAQFIGYHVPRRDSRFTLYDTFTIQLDHVKEST